MRHDAALPDTRRIGPIAAASMVIITTTITSTTSTTGAPPIVFFFAPATMTPVTNSLVDPCRYNSRPQESPPLPPCLPPQSARDLEPSLSVRRRRRRHSSGLLSTNHVLILGLGPSAPHLFRRHTTLPHSSTSRPAAAASSSSSFPPSPSSFSFRPTPHPQPHSSPVQLTRHSCLPHSPLHPSQNPIRNQSVLAPRKKTTMPQQPASDPACSGPRHALFGPTVFRFRVRFRFTFAVCLFVS